MNRSNSQVINTFLIVVGGGILIFQTSTEAKTPYLMVVGLVLLMLGLYRATNYWVETKDDHKEDNSDSKDQ